MTKQIKLKSESPTLKTRNGLSNSLRGLLGLWLLWSLESTHGQTFTFHFTYPEANQNAFGQQTDLDEVQNVSYPISTPAQELAQEAPPIVNMNYDQQNNLDEPQNINYPVSTPAQELARDSSPVVEPKIESVDKSDVPSKKPSYKPKTSSKPIQKPSYTHTPIKKNGSLSSKISMKGRKIAYKKDPMENHNQVITVKNLHFQGLTVYS